MTFIKSVVSTSVNENGKHEVNIDWTAMGVSSLTPRRQKDQRDIHSVLVDKPKFNIHRPIYVLPDFVPEYFRDLIPDDRRGMETKYAQLGIAVCAMEIYTYLCLLFTYFLHFAIYYGKMESTDLMWLVAFFVIFGVAFSSYFLTGYVLWQHRTRVYFHSHIQLAMIMFNLLFACFHLTIDWGPYPDEVIYGDNGPNLIRLATFSHLVFALTMVLFVYADKPASRFLADLARYRLYRDRMLYKTLKHQFFSYIQVVHMVSDLRSNIVLETESLDGASSIAGHESEIELGEDGLERKISKTRAIDGSEVIRKASQISHHQSNGSANRELVRNFSETSRGRSASFRSRTASFDGEVIEEVDETEEGEVDTNMFTKWGKKKPSSKENQEEFKKKKPFQDDVVEDDPIQMKILTSQQKSSDKPRRPFEDEEPEVYKSISRRSSTDEPKIKLKTKVIDGMDVIRKASFAKLEIGTTTKSDERMTKRQSISAGVEVHDKIEEINEEDSQTEKEDESAGKDGKVHRKWKPAEGDEGEVTGSKEDQTAEPLPPTLDNHKKSTTDETKDEDSKGLLEVNTKTPTQSSSSCDNEKVDSSKEDKSPPNCEDVVQKDGKIHRKWKTQDTDTASASDSKVDEEDNVKDQTKSDANETSDKNVIENKSSEPGPISKESKGNDKVPKVSSVTKTVQLTTDSMKPVLAARMKKTEPSQVSTADEISASDTDGDIVGKDGKIHRKWRPRETDTTASDSQVDETTDNDNTKIKSNSKDEVKPIVKANETKLQQATSQVQAETSDITAESNTTDQALEPTKDTKSADSVDARELKDMPTVDEVSASDVDGEVAQKDGKIDRKCEPLDVDTASASDSQFDENQSKIIDKASEQTSKSTNKRKSIEEVLPSDVESQSDFDSKSKVLADKVITHVLQMAPSESESELVQKDGKIHRKWKPQDRDTASDSQTDDGTTVTKIASKTADHRLEGKSSVSSVETPKTVSTVEMPQAIVANVDRADTLPNEDEVTVSEVQKPPTAYLSADDQTDSHNSTAMLSNPTPEQLPLDVTNNFHHGEHGRPISPEPDYSPASTTTDDQRATTPESMLSQPPINTKAELNALANQLRSHDRLTVKANGNGPLSIDAIRDTNIDDDVELKTPKSPLLKKISRRDSLNRVRDVLNEQATYLRDYDSTPRTRSTTPSSYNSHRYSNL